MPRTVTKNRRNGSRSAGFTLVELLVTISIIAILAAISLPAMNSFFQNAAEAQTKTLLKQLDSVVAEYTAQTQQTAFTTGGYDFLDGADLASDATSFADLYDQRVKDLEPALEMMETVNESYIVRDTTTSEFISVNDAWGRPVRYFPGTLAFEDNGEAVPAPSDLEDKGMRRRKSSYFASAGNDGFWGTVDSDTDTPDELAEDNVYSFEAD